MFDEIDVSTGFVPIAVNRKDYTVYSKTHLLNLMKECVESEWCKWDRMNIDEWRFNLLFYGIEYGKKRLVGVSNCVVDFSDMDWVGIEYGMDDRVYTECLRESFRNLYNDLDENMRNWLTVMRCGAGQPKGVLNRCLQGIQEIIDNLIVVLK